jgi:hypothetical protein
MNSIEWTELEGGQGKAITQQASSKLGLPFHRED